MVVRVILDGVLGVTIVVLIGHDEVLVRVVIYVAIFLVIFCNWRCTLYRKRDVMQKCCRILTAWERRDWKTWNDVPLELRKDIERIHRNLGHASVDQLEKFRDANVSDDAVSAMTLCPWM